MVCNAACRTAVSFRGKSRYLGEHVLDELPRNFRNSVPHLKRVLGATSGGVLDATDPLSTPLETVDVDGMIAVEVRVDETVRGSPHNGLVVLVSRV